MIPLARFVRTLAFCLVLVSSVGLADARAPIHLSEHFSLLELHRSSTADRLGIPTSVSVSQAVKLTLLCQRILEPTRAACGPLQVMSGLRSVELNRAVLGVEGSQHIEGEAADIRAEWMTTRQLFLWMAANAEFDQLIYYSTHVHVSYRMRGRRQQTLAAKRTRKGWRYVRWNSYLKSPATRKRPIWHI